MLNNELHLPKMIILGFLKGHSTGIQFFVFPKKIIVHLIICCFEIINIRLVWCWSWKFHMSSCSKGSDTESSFAEDVVRLHAPVLVTRAHHGHSQRRRRHDGCGNDGGGGGD